MSQQVCPWKNIKTTSERQYAMVQPGTKTNEVQSKTLWKGMVKIQRKQSMVSLQSNEEWVHLEDQISMN